MSKFFQALERAKRERILQEAAAQPEWKGPAEIQAKPEPVVQQKEQVPSERPVESGIPYRGLMPSIKLERISRAEPSSTMEQDFTREVDPHLISLLSPNTFEAEQYRTLRYSVEHMRRECDLQIVAVTSPAAGDGKSTTSINLAGAFAQTPEVRVLIVDTDLRRPSVCQQLGFPNSDAPGLTEAILDKNVSLKDVVLRRPPFNISVLPVGRMVDAPYEVLRSPRFGEVLKEARGQYDFIVLDTPPLLALPDCRVIAKWVDGFILVVAAHRTPGKLLEEALNIMDPDKMVGLVFNADDRSLMGYDGYYYAYGPSLKDSGRNGKNGKTPGRKKLSSMVF